MTASKPSDVMNRMIIIAIIILSIVNQSRNERLTLSTVSDARLAGLVGLLIYTVREVSK